MNVLPLTKVDVTRRPALDAGSVWLLSQGFRVKFDGNKVFLVRPVSHAL